jgi:hypothetical protein
VSLAIPGFGILIVFAFVLVFMDPRVRFSMFLVVRFEMQVFVLFAVLRSGVGGHGDFVHFIGERVGLVLRLFVIGIMIGFVICLVIGFVLRFHIFFRVRFQRILQFFQLGGFDKCFGYGFDRLGPVLGIGLRFFVLGFG